MNPIIVVFNLLVSFLSFGRNLSCRHFSQRSSDPAPIRTAWALSTGGISIAIPSSSSASLSSSQSLRVCTFSEPQSSYSERLSQLQDFVREQKALHSPSHCVGCSASVPGRGNADSEIFLGSFILTPAAALRYERHDRKSQQMTKEEELGIGKDRRRVDINEEYYRLAAKVSFRYLPLWEDSES